MIHARSLLGWLAPVGLSLSLALSGCSSSSSDDDAQGPSASSPLMTVKSESGAVTAEVRTGPSQPPPRGVISLDLRLTDAGGNALDGVTIEATPWMPAMGHGSSMKPTVAAEGGGRYLVSNVSCFMAGTWEIRTTLSGRVSDKLTITLDIP